MLLDVLLLEFDVRELLVRELRELLVPDVRELLVPELPELEEPLDELATLDGVELRSEVASATVAVRNTPTIRAEKITANRRSLGAIVCLIFTPPHPLMG